VACFLGVVVATASVQLLAQTPTAPSFDAVSIKPHAGDGPSRARVQPGRFTATNTPVVILIRQAFDILPSQIDRAPAWLMSEGYDITAKAPDGAGPASKMPMLRSLLEERFRLRTHLESRDLPIYELVHARPDRRLGPQLTKARVDCTENMFP